MIVQPTKHNPRVSTAIILLAFFSLALGAGCIQQPTHPTRSITKTPSPKPETSYSPAVSSRASLTPNQSDLDMREANVVDVRFEKITDDGYRFDVTLVHDDLGEAPDFANWWVVEDVEGVELGRRVLLHSHGNLPFTRSETITIPEDVKIVIVRGHDMQHGYGGQAIRVNLLTGKIEAVPDRE